jgi:hypothetical protein
VSDLRPIRVAYADPPYPGSARLYAKPGTPEYHPDAMRWDDPAAHVELLARLDAQFPDGWAFSTCPDALPALLAAAPPGTRVAAWVRGGVRSWEPVLFRLGARRGGLATPGLDVSLVHFWTVSGFVGQKPPAFAAWLFRLLCLGAHQDDVLVDLFPGSGAVTRAWDEFRGQAVTRRGVTQGALFDGAA